MQYKVKKNLRLIIASVVLALVVLVFFVIKPFKKGEKITYTYAKADVGDVTKTVSTSGKLELIESYLISSVITGIITEVNVQLNQRVEQNQQLAFIDSPETLQAFEDYKETYRFAQLDLKDLRDVYRTKQELLRDNLISRKEYDDAKLAYERAEFNFKTTQLQYDTNKANVELRYVRAPVSGIVLQNNAVMRQAVAVGTVLFEIVPSLDTMRLLINIDESDVGHIKPGMLVNFTVSAYPDQTFEGTIDQVKMTPTQVDGITMYQTIVICKNRDNMLRPGMNAEATVFSSEVKKVLRVPNQAFFIVPEGEKLKDKEVVVWLKSGVGGKSFKKVPVETGLEGDSHTVILSGKLKSGDEVLVSVSREK